MSHECDKQCIDPTYFRGGANKLGGVESLDATIKEYEQTIEALKAMIKEKEAYLSELREVRKLISPEMEASIRALLRRINAR